MKNTAFTLTIGLPDALERRASPRSGGALSDAQQQAAYGERQKSTGFARQENVASSFSGISDEKVLECLLKGGPDLRKSAWKEYGRRMGWL